MSHWDNNQPVVEIRITHTSQNKPNRPLEEKVFPTPETAHPKNQEN